MKACIRRCAEPSLYNSAGESKIGEENESIQFVLIYHITSVVDAIDATLKACEEPEYSEGTAQGRTGCAFEGEARERKGEAE